MNWYNNVFKKLSESQENILELNGKVFTIEQLTLAREIHLALIEEFEKKPNLSLRRACIVILQELYYDQKQYPKDLDSTAIYNRAYQRFSFVHRDAKSTIDIEKMNPKNPCLYFEDNARLKAGYIRSLELLVVNPEKYFEVDNAIPSLKVIFKEVTLC